MSFSLSPCHLETIDDAEIFCVHTDELNEIHVGRVQLLVQIHDKFEAKIDADDFLAALLKEVLIDSYQRLEKGGT